MSNRRATRIRVLLAERGMTQKDLAEMTGLEVDQVSHICSGKKTNIMLETAKRICLALGVTLDDAFGED